MNIKEQLHKLIDEPMVEVEMPEDRWTDCEINDVFANLYGKLEAPQPEEEEAGTFNHFYLRIGDTQSGTCGIRFRPAAVERIDKMVYHWRVTLK